MGEQQRQAVNPVREGIQRLVSQAASSGELIWPGRAVLKLQTEFPETSMSPAEIGEALVRAAAAQGLSLALNKLDVAQTDQVGQATPPS